MPKPIDATVTPTITANASRSLASSTASRHATTTGATQHDAIAARRPRDVPAVAGRNTPRQTAMRKSPVAAVPTIAASTSSSESMKERVPAWRGAPRRPQLILTPLWTGTRLRPAAREQA